MAYRRNLFLLAGAAGAAISLVFVAPPLVHPAIEPAEANCRNATKQPRAVTRKQARKAVVCLINERRAARGRPRVEDHPALREAAVRHSRRMLRERCFAHRCAGEPDLAGRLLATPYLPCGCEWKIAENIAWGEGRAGTARAIVRSWMRSAPHRKVMLTSRFQRLGVGVLKGRPSSPGDRGAATYTADSGFKG